MSNLHIEHNKGTNLEKQTCVKVAGPAKKFE